jgi:type IV conjugative transfer system protein TraL
MQSDDRDRHIPNRADDPVPILFWEPLEFVLGVSVLGLGIAVNLWLTGALLSILILWLMKRLKRGTKRGAAQHALWASGMQIDRAMGAFPPSWENEFME